MKKRILSIIIIIIQLGVLFYSFYQFYNSYENYKKTAQYQNKATRNDVLDKLEKDANNVIYWIIRRDDTRQQASFTLYISPENKKEVEENILKQREVLKQVKLEPYKKELVLEIPSIDLEVPTKKLEGNNLKEIEEKLLNNVIRYSRKDINHDGITVIYWHSSQPLLSKKDYSFFRNLPIATIGQEAYLKNEDETFTYKLIESKEIETETLTKVIDEYDQKGEIDKERYILLVTCYPINTTKKRWITILKKD